MKIFVTISGLIILLFTFSKNEIEEVMPSSKLTFNEAIVIKGKIDESALKTLNGCGIGNFLIPSTGDSISGNFPLLGSLIYNWDLNYNILDTIPGTKIKGVTFKRDDWNENTSVAYPEGSQYPYVVISDEGIFSYSFPPDFDPYTQEIIKLDTILIPNIIKVAKEITIGIPNPIVLFIRDSTDNSSVHFYSYPELEEQFKFSFQFEPEIFEIIENNLFITGLDTSGNQKLYHYSTTQDTLFQTYSLNDSLSNAQEIIKSDSLLYILSSPGDSITILSILNLTSSEVSQSTVYLKSGARATHNEFKGNSFFTFQPISDPLDSILDKQILILDPETSQIDTLLVNLKLDYFKHPSEASQSFGSFNLEWIGAKWEENNSDSVFIKQMYQDDLKVQTGSFPQYINATYGCWVGVNENEIEQIKFEYYPNPTSSIVTINLIGLIKDTQYKLDIIDNSGRMLFTTYVKAYQKIDLPLQDFAKGIYFLNLDTGKNIISRKLIIQ